MGLEQLFHELEEVYASYESARIKPSGNSCGTCSACCRAGASSVHNVTRLELAYLAHHLGSESSGRFQSYAARERDAKGRLLYEVCPNYDQNQRGCSVYVHRPFSCRVFGTYAQVGSRLPDKCVFEESVVRLERESFTEGVPGGEALDQLEMRMRFLEKDNSDAPVAEEELRPKEAFGYALQAAREGDFAQARAHLQFAAEVYGPTEYFFYNAGLIYAMVGDLTISLSCFHKALELEPKNATLLYFAGLISLQLGEKDAFLKNVKAALKYKPDYPQALEQLARFYLGEGQKLQAVPLLEAAIRLQPANVDALVELKNQALGKLNKN